MRLKVDIKIILFVVLAIVAIYFVRKHFSSSETDNTGELFAKEAKQEKQAEEPEKPEEAKDETRVPQAASKTETSSFELTPEKPEKGKLKGVVELGAAGFNSFVINVDKQKRWEIVSKDFGESLAYEGLATTDDIRYGLKKYLTGMFDKGVLKNDMHFVISSGAQKEPKTTLIANELKTFGYVVNPINAEKEGKLAFRATVPRSYENESFLVDIGSGTTKVSWKEGDDLKSLELPGSKYFEKGTSDEKVYAEVKSKMAQVPEARRNTCFILGGVPFTFAKQDRNGDERFTVLAGPDNYKPNDKKTIAGLNIYRAITDATKCQKFVFDWDSNFTIGFLLSLR